MGDVTPGGEHDSRPLWQRDPNRWQRMSEDERAAYKLGRMDGVMSAADVLEARDG